MIIILQRRSAIHSWFIVVLLFAALPMLVWGAEQDLVADLTSYQEPCVQMQAQNNSRQQIKHLTKQGLNKHSLNSEITNRDMHRIKTYPVKKIDRAVQLSGTGSDALWQHAVVLNDFSYPWEFDPAIASTSTQLAKPLSYRSNASEPLKDIHTNFKALWSDEHFYFLFEVQDEHIADKYKQLAQQQVIDSDRVELFFKSDDAMRPYYSLEMDPLARLLDTKGNYYRDIDFNWNWPDNTLKLMSSVADTSYSLEGEISLLVLRELNLYHDDNMLQAGVYRAEYDEAKKARWISWVVPDSATPDFHIPSSFGVFNLVE